MSIKQEQNSYRCDITRSTQLNSLYFLYSLYSLSSLSWHLKTLFKPSLFKSSCFKHLNIPWLMKHGLNPLYHWIKHVMINETWFKPSLLTKRFPLGTEWDLHDFLGPLPFFPCITWLPKTFSFRYRIRHSWLHWPFVFLPWLALLDKSWQSWHILTHLDTSSNILTHDIWKVCLNPIFTLFTLYALYPLSWHILTHPDTSWHILTHPDTS